MADGDAPGERGTLQVADRALESLAEQAALGVRGVARTTAGPLGHGLPAVQVTSAGLRARVALQVASVWPEPAARVAADVRAAVAAALLDLGGVHADAVAVTVTAVVDPPETRKGRVR